MRWRCFICHILANSLEDLRTFSNSFRICYTKVSGSPYTRFIDRFVDAVEEINEIEVVVGATALIAI